MTAPAVDIEVLRRTRTDPDFYALLGPFLARREVVAAVGGPVWDDDGKAWSVACRGGAVMGFVGATVVGAVATVCSGYVVSGGADAAAIWDALLGDALAGLAGRASVARATVGAVELPHYRRAGFKAVRARGQYTIVERAVP